MDEILFNSPSRKQRIREARADTATGDLFAVPATNSRTSRAAAEKVDVKAFVKLQINVMNTIEAAGPDGRARFQVAGQLGLEQSRISSSVDALLRRGDIVELDRDIQNPTTGAWCAVLVAKRYVTRAA